MDAFEREMEQHRRWRLKPQFAGFRAFDELLMNEFVQPETQRLRVERAVRGMVAYAVEHSPYYAALFRRQGLTPRDIGGPEDLASLPTLTKHDLLEEYGQLLVPQLPKGEWRYAASRSSGTTGRQVQVLHSFKSTTMFGLLRQRTARFHEIDPMGSRLEVKPRADLFRDGRGSMRKDSELAVLPAWQALGKFFYTGPEYGLTTSTPVERQVELVREARPVYATTLPGVFEEWLMANGGRRPTDSLKAIIGIGSQLTPSLRARLEASYGCPVHMSYGLNEIGKVATRCKAGRYHVNIEHCLVQIVHADGRPCAPGEIGHLLVTGLNNAAMPLFRYDTGDLAEAVDGPCPCGRTLPSFGDISGRYRSYVGLPPLSRERVRAVRVAVEGYPPADLAAFLRRYQLYQDRRDRWTLRLRNVAPVPEAFCQHVLDAWAPVLGAPPSPLAIAVVDEIAASPGGKLLDFVSEFHTDSSLPIEYRMAAQAPA